MSTAGVVAMPSHMRIPMLAIAGAILGLAYTLSPLSVLSLALLVWVMVAASSGQSEGERRWYWTLLIGSVAIRLIAIALLFLTADPAHPFASFFGDEELYKFRTMWLRNIGEDLPMSPADVIYSFDEVGHTSFIYILAYTQALVGDAPYGLHVMNMTLYFCGVLLLYRLARGAFGVAVAMGGLLALLFIPSMVLWSVSVLKEPMSIFIISVELAAAVALARAPRLGQKALAVLVVMTGAVVMESLRTGGRLTAVTGTLGGLALAFVLSRGRRLALAMVAAPVVLVVVFSLPAVQDRLLSNVRLAAFYHAGHVLTPGYSYQLVHPQYYPRREQLLNIMPPPDAARFVAKAVWYYFAQPLPWETKSRAMLGYLPEQVVWYVLVLLLPFGIYAGLKRDVVVTSVLAAHAVAAILIVALSSGNIGTLIRHRALALPYIVWLSGVGAHDLVRRAAARSASLETRSSNGDR